MMRTTFVRWFTETTVVMSSCGFLAWYIWAKVADVPWNL